MDDFDPAELERIRRYGRADWRRLVHPGRERGLTPAQREAQRKKFATWERAFETPLARRLRKEREERAHEEQERLEAEQQRELQELRASHERVKAELAEINYELASRRLCRKYGYNPDQERVPAGSGIESGRWTRVAGKLPPTLGHNSGNFDIPPERPEDSRERTGAIRAAARFLARIPGPIGRAAALLTIFEGASWLREHKAEIETQLDPPKTLEELQEAVDVDRPGTQKHHIVEQGPAERDGFQRSQIDAPDNLVRISKQKHQEISEWFSRKNVRYGLETPRDWLRGKSWEERRAVGIEKLIDVGVLKP